MAAFTEQETEQQWDYELLQDGAVSGFVGEAQLESVLGQLRTLGYGIAETHGDDGHVMLLGNLFEQVSLRYCGLSVQNLDALRDTARCIDFTDVKGWALVIRRFDETFRADRQWAQDVADLLAEASYEHPLMGNRLLILLHSEENTVELGRLGGHTPWWHHPTANRPPSAGA
jgi:hypothetical protein